MYERWRDPSPAADQRLPRRGLARGGYHAARVGRVLLIAAALCVTAAVAVSGVTGGPSSPSVSTGRPLATAVFDPGNPSRSASRDVRAAGATFARLLLRWPAVAPGGNSAPTGFDARNPGDAALPLAVLRHGGPDGRGCRTPASRRPSRRARVGTREDLRRRCRREVPSHLRRPRRLCDRGRQAVSGWLPWAAARPLLAGLERAEPEHRAHAPGGGRQARIAGHLSRHGQRSGQERPRRAQGQRRRRRWARAVRGRHQRSVRRPCRGPDTDSSDGLHASLPLHVVRLEARGDLRRQGRVRCMGASPLHVRRAHPQGVRPRRRLSRRPRQDEVAPEGRRAGGARQVNAARRQASG